VSGTQSVISLKTLVPIGLVGTVAAVAFVWGAHYERISFQDDRLKALEDMHIPVQLGRIDKHLAVIEQHLNIRIPARSAFDEALSPPEFQPPSPPKPQSRPRRSVADVEGN